MSSRIPFDAPEGYMWVPERSKGWRPVTAKRCRRMITGRKVCTNEAVMELNRGQLMWHRRSMIDSWWAYCLDHAYGHWLEDGEVWEWHLVEVASV